MRIAREGFPFVVATTIPGLLVAGFGATHGFALLVVMGLIAALLGASLMLFFFRDPARTPASDTAILSAADGVVKTVSTVFEPTHLKTECVRVSVYLGLGDVHINRVPLPGVVRHVSYERGRHRLTRNNRASDDNQHSSIVIEGEVPCLVKQIVGPLVRRVVTSLKPGSTVTRGQRLGLMKFGSRLDLYFPVGTVLVLVQPRDRVRAGETPIAHVLPGVLQKKSS